MIPADRFLLNPDGTAWLVCDSESILGPGLFRLNDRTCDTCRGRGQIGHESYDTGLSWSKCPDCIDGRHTFTVSVECPVGHPSTPCRIWPGVIHSNGYGQAYNPETQATMKAHRKVWIEANGPIPTGMVLMHRCDNPPCVRLDHLRLGCRAENQADMRAKGRSANGAQFGRSTLTPVLVAEIRVSTEPNTVLGKRYGVADTVIGKIKRREIWNTPDPCGCTQGVVERRCSIVPGMVLPIYENDTRWGGNLPVVTLEPNGYWHRPLGLTERPQPITLPPAAAPGMYAVKLKVAS